MCQPRTLGNEMGLLFNNVRNNINAVIAKITELTVHVRAFIISLTSSFVIITGSFHGERKKGIVIVQLVAYT